MKFRYARHTHQLDAMTRFYTEVIGLEILGGFKDHDGYDGVFLGHPQQNWHLEFTASEGPAQHQPAPDDLLVFYLHSTAAINAILDDAAAQGIFPQSSQNPYWQKNGVELADPDGFGIMLTLEDQVLSSSDLLSEMARSAGCHSWNTLLQYVQQLPYGRNEDRANPILVLTERKGTCSTKHALLKKIAELNGIPGVQLLLGIYKMSEANTPGVGAVLAEHQLDYLPEAHCYLRVQGEKIDLTHRHAKRDIATGQVLEELEIQVPDIGDFKQNFHQNYLRKWQVDLPFEQLWRIREKCIARLAANK